MIKFFRKIRYELIGTNKSGKYLKYAIGEIILVVIGILIALQINNWNTERLNRLKENDYLNEIKVNLLTDKTSIQKVFNHNTIKIAAIEESFELFKKASNNENIMAQFLPHVGPLAEFELFVPIRSTFDNMLSADKIDIVQNNKLRKYLSEYYSGISVESGTQERIKILSRKFADEISRKIMPYEEAQNFANIDLNLKHEETPYFEDTSVIAIMFIMKLSTIGQNELLEDTNKQIDEIINLINKELL